MYTIIEVNHPKPGTSIDKLVDAGIPLGKKIIFTSKEKIGGIYFNDLENFVAIADNAYLTPKHAVHLLPETGPVEVILTGQYLGFQYKIGKAIALIHQIQQRPGSIHVIGDETFWQGQLLSEGTKNPAKNYSGLLNTHHIPAVVENNPSGNPFATRVHYWKQLNDFLRK